MLTFRWVTFAKRSSPGRQRRQKSGHEKLTGHNACGATPERPHQNGRRRSQQDGRLLRASRRRIIDAPTGSPRPEIKAFSRRGIKPAMQSLAQARLKGGDADGTRLAKKYAAYARSPKSPHIALAAQNRDRARDSRGVREAGDGSAGEL